MERSGPTHDFKPKFDSLLHMGELYSYHHLNFPSAAKDQQIPASTKERMMNAATQSSVYPLVATGATRYFLMTKLILQWIINQLFTRSLFAGLDEEADRRIDQLRAAIFLGRLNLPQDDLTLC